MLHFIDINVAGPALSHLGAPASTNDIVHAPSNGNVAVAALQHAVREAVAGRIELVFSATSAKTLFQLLLRGGQDFPAMPAAAARDAVNVLVRLAQASDTYVTRDEVTDLTPAARAVCADHYGHLKGQVDDEDLWVIASLLALQTEDEPAVLVTQDIGLLNCARPLARKRIGVVKGGDWLFLQTGQRRVA